MVGVRRRAATQLRRPLTGGVGQNRPGGEGPELAGTQQGEGQVRVGRAAAPQHRRICGRLLWWGRAGGRQDKHTLAGRVRQGRMGREGGWCRTPLDQKQKQRVGKWRSNWGPAAGLAGRERGVAPGALGSHAPEALLGTLREEYRRAVCIEAHASLGREGRAGYGTGERVGGEGSTTRVDIATRYSVQGGC